MPRPDWNRLRRHAGAFDALGVAGALLVACVVLGFATDTFLATDNLIKVARQASAYAILAVGMVFVLTIGEVDLSVGAIVTLVNVVTAIALREGVPVGGAVLIGLALGTACGAANGALSVVVRVPVIIVTLGTMAVYRGLAIGFSESRSISRFPKTGPFFTVGGGDVAGLPVGVWVMLVLCAAGYVLLNHTAFGWRLQAIGSNRRAARFSGVPLRRYKVVVTAVMGGVCGLVALIAVAFFKSGNPNTGVGYELVVIASAIIGGTSLSGGSGSVVGAVLGALLIAVINDGMNHLGVPSDWNLSITGGVILVAVGLSSLINRSKSEDQESS